MQIIVRGCPKCSGNLVLTDSGKLVSCEDCDYQEQAKSNGDWKLAVDLADEWGPKEKRLKDTDFTFIGKLILDAYRNEGILTTGGMAIGEALDQMRRGLEPEDIGDDEIWAKIKEWRLVRCLGK